MKKTVKKLIEFNNLGITKLIKQDAIIMKTDVNSKEK